MTGAGDQRVDRRRGTSLSSIPLPRQGVGPGGSMCSSASRAVGISVMVSMTGPRSRSGETALLSSATSP
jgi:hypothetical protein